MSRPLRVVIPGEIYAVSNRTLYEMFKLRPDPVVNARILGCLARAARIHNVRILGYVFLGNHFHLLIQILEANLSEFMRDFQRWVGDVVRDHHGFTGRLFGQRYKAMRLADDAVVYDQLLYMMTNPVHHGLVENLEEYPGLCSWKQCIEGGVVTGEWVRRGDLNRKRRLAKKRGKDVSEIDESAFIEHYTLELTPIPQLAGLSQKERGQRILKRLSRRLESLRRQRGGRPYLGAEALQKQSIWDHPKSPKFTEHCPQCIASDPAKVEAWKEHYDRVLGAYRRATKKLHSPKRKEPVEFPPGTMPPGRQQAVPYTKKQLEACPVRYGHAPPPPGGACPEATSPGAAAPSEEVSSAKQVG